MLMKDRLENFLTRKYHADFGYIRNGKLYVEWHTGNPKDFMVMSVSKALFKVLTSKQKPLPSNWKAMADLWVLNALNIHELEEELGMKVIEMPNELFKFTLQQSIQYGML